MWKKKSIFWELPYWKFLEVHSAIDVMHVTKNLCVNLLNFLGVYGKTKDTPDARQDQQSIHEGNNLNPEKYQGPASYALTKEEKEIFFEVLSSIKVPSGFSSNIKGIINMSEKKFQNLKSHDCHVIMTQLLPIALRGLLPENVRVPIVKLCAFLNAISQKVINPLTLQNLQKDVVQCLVSFELVFPPSFFNIMTHLLVHLVEEIGVLGPVFLHNMFPFERFMGVLKKYVHNRVRPEGSISKGYGTEEVIEFCVDFIPDLKPIGVPESRYEGRLRGKGTLGKKSATCMDEHSFTQAHYTVLHNSILVAPYKEEHKEILRSKYPEQREDWIDGEHMKTFGGWLQTRLMNVTDDEQLYLLAKQPSSTISTFQGYEINGNTFYTFAQDKKSTNQNSGVRAPEALAVADHAALFAIARPRRRQTTPPRHRQTTPSSPAAPSPRLPLAPPAPQRRRPLLRPAAPHAPAPTRGELPPPSLAALPRLASLAAARSPRSPRARRLPAGAAGALPSRTRASRSTKCLAARLDPLLAAAPPMPGRRAPFPCLAAARLPCWPRPSHAWPPRALPCLAAAPSHAWPPRAPPMPGRRTLAGHPAHAAPKQVASNHIAHGRLPSRSPPPSTLPGRRTRCK
ncbi:hypothetical protein QYE76_000347 [Lolium multiflorum]|uniref:DUF4218 domain-containing protein n=1 Tax=Lolium multiflorum TaxID=4521 RepID=A0AAD8RK09_LOLMU|nr:hypothetical protein QYE76_000347 [Lolium multiflorum]